MIMEDLGYPFLFFSFFAGEDFPRLSPSSAEEEESEKGRLSTRRAEV